VSELAREIPAPDRELETIEIDITAGSQEPP
jgi:hypothetical protein